MPLPDYDDALRMALDGVETLGDEDVDLVHADGRILRETIVADRDLPPFNRAQMDGYAVRSAEIGTIDAFPVAATIAAGQAADVRVPPGMCVSIATGAPLPDDVDAVIQHELSDRGDARGEPVRFQVTQLAAGKNVHPRGSDARRGDRLMAVGTVLGPHHLGIVASVGLLRVRVSSRPRVVIITSGDEVMGVSDTVADHQIRNSNQPMLASLVTRMGAEVLAKLHLPDQLAPTIAAVGEALDRADVLITVGGVSAGERDHFPEAFEHHGVESKLRGAAIQPGRPIFVGCRQRDSRSTAYVAGLPGNPVSALACICLFVWPLLRELMGASAELPWQKVELAKPVRPNAKRQAFRPAILEENRATVPAWSGSGDLVHTAPTDGLLELPVQEVEVPEGTPLRFLPWP